MSRNADGNTKETILAAAFSVFMEKGFEETSVRMILEKADVTTGSFYHFFSSKDALFEAVIERYLQLYAQRVDAIACDGSLGAWERLEALLSNIERASNDYYAALHGNKLHWSVQYALHERTMAAVLPSVQRLIETAIADGTVSARLNVDTHTLSLVILRGVESILHANPMKDMDSEQIAEVKNSIKEYISLILCNNL